MGCNENKDNVLIFFFFFYKRIEICKYIEPHRLIILLAHVSEISSASGDHVGHSTWIGHPYVISEGETLTHTHHTLTHTRSLTVWQVRILGPDCCLHTATTSTPAPCWRKTQVQTWQVDDKWTRRSVPLESNLYTTSLSHSLTAPLFRFPELQFAPAVLPW